MANFQYITFTPQELALPLRMRIRMAHVYNEQWQSEVDALVSMRGWESVKATHFVGYRTVEDDTNDYEWETFERNADDAIRALWVVR